MTADEVIEALDLTEKQVLAAFDGLCTLKLDLRVARVARDSNAQRVLAQRDRIIALERIIQRIIHGEYTNLPECIIDVEHQLREINHEQEQEQA